LVEVPDFEPSSFEAEFGRHLAFAVPLAETGGLRRRLLAHGAALIEPERPTPFARWAEVPVFERAARPAAALLTASLFNKPAVYLRVARAAASSQSLTPGIRSGLTP
jgi:hypothetical protein